jgi:hypothetical protein
MTLDELLELVPSGWHDVLEAIDARASVAELLAPAMGITRREAYRLLIEQERLTILERKRYGP